MNIPDSERLVFRLLDCESSQDCAFLFDLDRDTQVMRFINGGRPCTQEEHERLRERIRAFTDVPQGWGLWGVCPKPDSKLIGWVLVRPIGFFTDAPQYSNLEVGWRFQSNSWGKGYATEAALAVMNALATSPKIRHFSAFAAPENLASVRIIEKVGMQPKHEVPKMEPGYTDNVRYFRMQSGEVSRRPK